MGLVLADHERGTGKRPLHRGVARDVVDVAVGVQDRGESQAVMPEAVQDRGRIEPGIDHQGLGGVVAPEQVRDLAERSRLDRFDRVSGLGGFRGFRLCIHGRMSSLHVPCAVLPDELPFLFYQTRLKK